MSIKNYLNTLNPKRKIMDILNSRGGLDPIDYISAIRGSINTLSVQNINGGYAQYYNLYSENISSVTAFAEISTNGIVRWKSDSFTPNNWFVGFKAGKLAETTIWTLPISDGEKDQVLTTDGKGILGWSVPDGSGDVHGPAETTIGAIAFWTDEVGKNLGNSELIIDAENWNLTTPGSITTESEDGIISGGPVRSTSLVLGEDVETSTTLTFSMSSDQSDALSLTFPSDAGKNAYVLTTDGEGTLNWSTVADVAKDDVTYILQKTTAGLEAAQGLNALEDGVMLKGADGVVSILDVSAGIMYMTSDNRTVDTFSDLGAGVMKSSSATEITSVARIEESDMPTLNETIYSNINPSFGTLGLIGDIWEGQSSGIAGSTDRLGRIITYLTTVAAFNEASTAVMTQGLPIVKSFLGPAATYLDSFEKGTILRTRLVTSILSPKGGLERANSFPFEPNRVVVTDGDQKLTTIGGNLEPDHPVLQWGGATGGKSNKFGIAVWATNQSQFVMDSGITIEANLFNGEDLAGFTTEANELTTNIKNIRTIRTGAIDVIEYENLAGSGVVSCNQLKGKDIYLYDQTKQGPGKITLTYYVGFASAQTLTPEEAKLLWVLPKVGGTEGQVMIRKGESTGVNPTKYPLAWGSPLVLSDATTTYTTNTLPVFADATNKLILNSDAIATRSTDLIGAQIGLRTRYADGLPAAVHSVNLRAPTLTTNSLTWVLPNTAGTKGQVLLRSDVGNAETHIYELSWGSAGGDVVGPTANPSNHCIPVWDVPLDSDPTLRKLGNSGALVTTFTVGVSKIDNVVISKGFILQGHTDIVHTGFLAHASGQTAIYTLPATIGASGNVLTRGAATSETSAALIWSEAGSGNVVGPNSEPPETRVTKRSIAIWKDTEGRNLIDSKANIDTAGHLEAVGLYATNTLLDITHKAGFQANAGLDLNLTWELPVTQGKIGDTLILIGEDRLTWIESGSGNVTSKSNVTVKGNIPVWDDLVGREIITSNVSIGNVEAEADYGCLTAKSLWVHGRAANLTKHFGFTGSDVLAAENITWVLPHTTGEDGQVLTRDETISGTVGYKLKWSNGGGNVISTVDISEDNDIAVWDGKTGRKIKTCDLTMSNHIAEEQGAAIYLRTGNPVLRTVGFKAPANTASSFAWILPTTPGETDEVLTRGINAIGGYSLEWRKAGGDVIASIEGGVRKNNHIALWDSPENKDNPYKIKTSGVSITPVLGGQPSTLNLPGILKLSANELDPEHVGIRSNAATTASYTLVLPLGSGTEGEVLTRSAKVGETSEYLLTWTASNGNVAGPTLDGQAHSTNNAIATWDGDNGNKLQNSSASILNAKSAIIGATLTLNTGTSDGLIAHKVGLRAPISMAGINKSVTWILPEAAGNAGDVLTREIQEEVAGGFKLKWGPGGGTVTTKDPTHHTFIATWAQEDPEAPPTANSTTLTTSKAHISATGNLTGLGIYVSNNPEVTDSISSGFQLQVAADASHTWELPITKGTADQVLSRDGEEPTASGGYKLKWSASGASIISGNPKNTEVPVWTGGEGEGDATKITGSGVTIHLRREGSTVPSIEMKTGATSLKVKSVGFQAPEKFIEEDGDPMHVSWILPSTRGGIGHALVRIDEATGLANPKLAWEAVLRGPLDEAAIATVIPVFLEVGLNPLAPRVQNSPFRLEPTTGNFNTPGLSIRRTVAGILGSTVGFQCPATLTKSIVWTLPDTYGPIGDTLGRLWQNIAGGTGETQLLGISNFACKAPKAYNAVAYGAGITLDGPTGVSFTSTTLRAGRVTLTLAETLTYILPPTKGAENQSLTFDSQLIDTGLEIVCKLKWATSNGNVVGPDAVEPAVPTTQHAIARWKDTTGRSLLDSSVVVDDAAIIETTTGATKYGPSITLQGFLGTTDIPYASTTIMGGQLLKATHINGITYILPDTAPTAGQALVSDGIVGIDPALGNYQLKWGNASGLVAGHPKNHQIAVWTGAPIEPAESDATQITGISSVAGKSLATIDALGNLTATSVATFSGAANEFAVSFFGSLEATANRNYIFPIATTLPSANQVLQVLNTTGVADIHLKWGDVLTAKADTNAKNRQVVVWTGLPDVEATEVTNAQVQVYDRGEAHATGITLPAGTSLVPLENVINIQAPNVLDAIGNITWILPSTPGIVGQVLTRVLTEDLGPTDYKVGWREGGGGGGNVHGPADKVITAGHFALWTLGGDVEFRIADSLSSPTILLAEANEALDLAVAGIELEIAGVEGEILVLTTDVEFIQAQVALLGGWEVIKGTFHTLRSIFGGNPAKAARRAKKAAKEAADKAKGYAKDCKNAAKEASKSAKNAEESASDAATSATTASDSATAAATSETNAATSETNAGGFATAASDSAAAALMSKNDAGASAIAAQAALDGIDNVSLTFTGEITGSGKIGDPIQLIYAGSGIPGTGNVVTGGGVANAIPVWLADAGYLLKNTAVLIDGSGDINTPGNLIFNTGVDPDIQQLILAPNASNAGYTFTFPENSGVADYYLQTDGTGITSWAPIDSKSGGTVTQVNTGDGLTGGPITVSGTVSLDTSGVTAGSYTNTNITVDKYGRILTAANGSGGGGSGTVTSITAGANLTGGTITSAGTIALNTTVTGLDSITSVAATVTGTLQGSTIKGTLFTATTSITGGTLVSKGDINASGDITGNTVKTTKVQLAANSNLLSLIAPSALSSAMTLTFPSTIVAGNYLQTDSSGNLTWAAAGGGGSGTVTEIDTGTGLTGGPITTTGTISIANTTVAAGAYTNANITVNQQGQITAAANGTVGGDVVGPDTSTLHGVAVWDNTTGTVLANSATTIVDGNIVTSGTTTTTQVIIPANDDFTLTLTKSSTAQENNVVLRFPSNQGSAGQVLATDGAGNLYWATITTDRNITGPDSSTPNAMAIWDTENGTVVQNSPIIIDDGDITTPGSVTGLGLTLII